MFTCNFRQLVTGAFIISRTLSDHSLTIFAGEWRHFLRPDKLEASVVWEVWVLLRDRNGPAGLQTWCSGLTAVKSTLGFIHVTCVKDWKIQYLLDKYISVFYDCYNILPLEKKLGPNLMEAQAISIQQRHNHFSL